MCQRYNGELDHCVAAAAVEIINAGKGGRKAAVLVEERPVRFPQETRC